MIERQRALLRLCVAYAVANYDDVLDAFAYSGDDDPDNEQGRIEVDGEAMPSSTDKELGALLKLLEATK